MPIHWTSRELGDLFEFKNGLNAGSESYGNGVKFINVMEVIYHHQIASQSIPGSVVVSKKQLEDFAVLRGDVLFNRTSEITNEVGLSSVYLDDEKVVFGGFVIRGRPKNKAINDDFKKYCFRSQPVREQIIRGGQGAVRSNIGQSDLEKVTVLLPPLPEQKAIAAALSLMDSAINKTNQLIVQKELQKKGLMQQLLTGKKRLRGFRGAWRTVRLGDVCDLVNGMAFKPEDWSISGIPIIRIQNLNGSKEFNHYDKNVEEKYLVKSNDLLFAWSGSRGTSFGSFIWHGGPAILNQHIFNVFPKNGLDKVFAFQILRWLTIGIETRAHGSAGLVHVTKKQLEGEKMRIPFGLNEQIAITQVLQTADKEIQLLRNMAERLKEQKKGMMQVLLTGKKRLKGFET
jgi:type I restriction enzyme S subunit